MEKSSSEEDCGVEQTDLSPTTSTQCDDVQEQRPDAVKAKNSANPAEISAVSDKGTEEQSTAAKVEEKSLSEKSTADKAKSEKSTDSAEKDVNDRKRKLGTDGLAQSSSKVPKVVASIRSIMAAMSAGDIVPVSA